MNKFDRLFSILPEYVDCVLITSDVNRRYFTGMKSSDGIVVAFRNAAYLIIDFRYIEKARETVTAAKVIEQGKVYQQISELVVNHSAHNVAIESQTLTVQRLNNFRKNVGGVEFIESDILSSAINSLRAAKGDSEIESIKKAQEIAEIAFENILDFIKPGVTEREIAMELEKIMSLNGSEGVSFETIVLTGAATSMPHGVPSDRIVQNGDFVLMDYGAIWNGYHSDMTRTVCVGKPSDEMEKVYNIVLEAQTAAIAAARAGITGKELDNVAREIITAAGYGEYFGHSLGHGVGLEIHEAPNAARSFDRELNENAVLTIEPGIYIAGKFGVRIEDFVILNKNGCTNLTKCAKNLISL